MSDAVENALKKIENITLVDDKPAEEVKEIEVGNFSEEQYQEALQTMEANRGAGEEPKVGIFWYNATLNQLFGVFSHKRTDYLRPNAGGGLITCSEMHEDVWKKEFRKQKYHNKGIGPFIGEYQLNLVDRCFIHPPKTNISSLLVRG